MKVMLVGVSLACYVTKVMQPVGQWTGFGFGLNHKRVTWMLTSGTFNLLKPNDAYVRQ